MGLRDGVAKNISTQLNNKRRTRVYNSGRLVVFVRVLDGGVEGASFKECEAAFLRLPRHVVIKIWQGGCYGSEEWCCKTDLNTTIY